MTVRRRDTGCRRALPADGRCGGDGGRLEVPEFRRRSLSHCGFVTARFSFCGPGRFLASGESILGHPDLSKDHDETCSGSTPKAAQRVLVVEDEPDIAALIAYQLTREGFRVETAATGTDALGAVNREIPDLVVLDRMLPGLSGDEVLQTLKGETATKAIPVLVLTAKREQEDRIEGFELGADDYLTKPFSPRELVLRVKAILRRIQEPRRSRAEESSGPVPSPVM